MDDERYGGLADGINKILMYLKKVVSTIPTQITCKHDDAGIDE